MENTADYDAVDDDVPKSVMKTLVKMMIVQSQDQK